MLSVLSVACSSEIHPLPTKVAQVSRWLIVADRNSESVSLRMAYDAPVKSDLDRTAGILRWRFLAVGGVLLSAMALGTLGFRLVEGWPLFDAFYMALMTLTTVGYGEVHPLSFHGRVFASFLMLVGVATVFVSFAVLGDTLLRLELADYFNRRRRTRMLQHIAGHYIVCGAGRVGRGAATCSSRWAND